jgi:hypothetical protein
MVASLQINTLLHFVYVPFNFSLITYHRHNLRYQSTEGAGFVLVSENLEKELPQLGFEL